jgi:spore coat protein H
MILTDRISITLFEVSTDWEFKTVVYEKKSNLISVQIDMLEPGTYFWRVKAVNSAGKFQYPFDYYTDEASSLNRFGMKSFIITPDGQVLER